MYKEIFFDHTFTEDPKHKFLKSLEKNGFILHDKTMEHPGKSICRFIQIGRKYLEFAHIGKGGISYNKPGISFGAKDLFKYQKKVEKKSSYQIDTIHKNYNWKENSTDRLPGWNFLHFNNLRIQTFYPWFTEYEDAPGRENIFKKNLEHPNGVNEIHGARFDLNKNGEKFFEAIFGSKLKPIVKLPCGFTFYFTFGKKTTLHRATILKSKSLIQTKKFMPKAIDTTFQDKDALLIRNPSSNARMWDIVII